MYVLRSLSYSFPLLDIFNFKLYVYYKYKYIKNKSRHDYWIFLLLAQNVGICSASFRPEDSKGW